jgi:hypothetical protein
MPQDPEKQPFRQLALWKFQSPLPLNIVRFAESATRATPFRIRGMIANKKHYNEYYNSYGSEMQPQVNLIRDDSVGSRVNVYNLS